MEAAADDQAEEGVRSPSVSGSLAQDEQLEQSLTRAAEGATEVPQASDSDSACSADPVRDFIVSRCKSSFTTHAYTYRCCS